MSIQWFLLLFCVSLSVIKKCSAIGPSLVHTSLGDIQGVADSKQRHFFGIPFAEPPIGSLRFRQAVPKKRWEGVYDATKLKPACHQPTQVPQDEDCLYLQVFTPPDIPSEKVLPVLFWIHGGGFINGAGSEYNGTYLANQGTVVVTINYRLNVFGYLQSEELANEDPEWKSLGGMNGMNDQTVALKWTIDNIAAFGGDPNDITISGESAGSLSVCMQLVSNYSKNMFNNAILESGSCIGPWGPATAKDGLQGSKDFMVSMGVKTVAELRKLDAKSIIANPDWATFVPSVDNFWLNDIPETYFKAGILSARPGGRFLLGANTLDTLYGPPWNAPPGAPTEMAAYHDSILKYFGRQTDTILGLYHPLTNDSIHIQQTWLSANADTCNLCPVRFLADYLASHNSVFLYLFGYNPNIPTSRWKGLAGHAYEIPFVFHTKYPGWPYDEDLSNIVAGYWTDFIHGTENTKPKWDEYKSGHEAYLSIKKPHTMEKGYVQKQCDFWHDYIQTPANRTNWFLFGIQGLKAVSTITNIK